ncbi:hypothetical protein [Bdellovibrio sp. NC01]|uniref:hypothetical protein n=1 Tax=Bdellovibrio sp. NC01 TaxID=2220073 RepID=UPI00115839EB|nr:hypothetical protein [Bdellovibrio sp. NC01]QDK38412.1 hypothetical protein DOE51_12915 [Bdellovibrio sp. NC01]
MKTNLLKLVKVVALAAMTMMLANCSKDSGSSNGAVAGYGLNQYGQCVYTATGQIAPNTTYCGTNTGYTYNSYGQCIQTSTGQAVAATYCATSGNSCNGTYYYGNGYGQVMSIQCSSTSTVYYSGSYQSGYGQVYNCRGLYLYQLVNYGTGQQYQQITCQ